MNAKSKNGGVQSPQLPDLPDFGQMELPELPDLDAIGEVEVPDMEDILNPPKSLIEQRIDFGDNAEENAKMVDEVIVEEFAAIHEGRKKQQEAIELANDTEYWFAMYFQTREQKEAFLKAVKWIQHGDKYIDGQWAAKRMGIELPPRPAPYKVGKLDKKLTDLT